MKILYDHQAFTGTLYGGIARYFCDLITTLNDVDGITAHLATKYSNNIYLQENEEFNVANFEFLIGKRLTNLFFSHFNRADSAFHILRKKYDVFHPTFFNPYFIDFIGKKPFVMTYHDAIPEKFSQKYGEIDGVAQDTKKRLFDKASQIIAISENTKKDILEIYDLDPAKVTVVHHGSKFIHYAAETPQKLPVFRDYLLYVGARSLYKNFDNFLVSVTDILHENKIQLICAGGGAFNETERELIAKLGLTDLVFQKSINDDQLFWMYKNALAFVYPSQYEGFGIPIIEAFAANCPVLLSNTSCFPEVAGDAGLYFDPTKQQEMASQIQKILSDQDLRTTLITKGKQRVQQFTLQNMAKNTLNVYEKVVNRSL